MLCLCEDSINEEIIWKIINLILNTKELQQYTMFRYFIAMQNMLEDTDVEALYHVGITILGELFKLIIGVSTTDEEGKTITITEEQIIDLVTALDKSSDTSESLRELLMNACFKMLGKMSPESDEKLKKILRTESKSFYPEVQERANEYITFTQIAKDDMQVKITANVPVPKFDNEENEGSNNNVGEEPPIEHKDTIVEEYETDKGYRNLINGASVTGDSSGIGETKTKKKKKPKKEVEPVPMGGESKQPQQQQPASNANVGGIDLFGDIFGGVNTAPTTNTNNTGNTGGDIFNLLGNIGSSNQNQGANNQGGLGDLNSILSGTGSAPQQNAGGMNLDFMGMGGGQPQQSTPQNLNEVFKNEDISIFSSLNHDNNVYNGSFYVSNNANTQINDVTFNFLVKKYIHCQVHSTTGKDLAPNASLGIKKDVTMTSSDTSKNWVIKIAISYFKNGNKIDANKIITL